MQQYLWKNAFREKMDALGLTLLMAVLCLGWFLMLWGVRLQSLMAGLSLFCLCLMIRSRTRTHRLNRKEQRLRCQLGGEMQLEQMLLKPEREAHFEIALHLSAKEAWQLLRMTDQGVLCKKGERTILLSFLSLPMGEKLGARDVLSLQRHAHQEQADEVWLALPCAMGEDARRQGETLLPVHFVERGQLIHLLGNAAPATDAQLVALGKLRRKCAPLKSLFHSVLQREKLRKYALYGAMLLFLYTLTGLFYYAVPGLICILLATWGHAISR